MVRECRSVLRWQGAAFARLLQRRRATHECVRLVHVDVDSGTGVRHRAVHLVTAGVRSGLRVAGSHKVNGAVASTVPQHGQADALRASRARLLQEDEGSSRSLSALIEPPRPPRRLEFVVAELRRRRQRGCWSPSSLILRGAENAGHRLVLAAQGPNRVGSASSVPASAAFAVCWLYRQEMHQRHPRPVRNAHAVPASGALIGRWASGRFTTRRSAPWLTPAPPSALRTPHCPPRFPTPAAARHHCAHRAIDHRQRQPQRGEAVGQGLPD